MIFAAILVGLLVAYYLGVERGAAAAVAVAVLFLVAGMFPQIKTLVYILIGAGVAAVSLFGPTVQTEETRQGFDKWRRQAERLGRLLLKLNKK